MVEKVGVHQVEKPRETLDGSGQYRSLAQTGDCLSLYAVEGGGLYYGQQCCHQGHHTPSHQEIFLKARSEEPLGGLESKVVGGYDAETCLPTYNI